MEAENTVIRSSCPLCAAVLKFRNASFVERPFRCSECKGNLRLVQGLENFYHVVAVEDDASSHQTEKESSKDSQKPFIPRDHQKTSQKPEKINKVLSLLKSPTGISWSVALAGLAIFLIFTLPNPNEKETNKVTEKENTIAKSGIPEETKTRFLETQPLIASKPITKFTPVIAKPKAKKNLKKIIGATKKNSNAKKVSPKLPLVALRPLPTQLEAIVPAQQYLPEDFEKAFAQKIKLFMQPKPVPVRLLLEELEDMSGIPIRFDPSELADAGSILDQKLKLNLSETNIGEILNQILKTQNLAMKTDEKGILITRKSNR